MQLLRKLLFPFSLIYALTVHLRNFLFDVGILKSNTYHTPTICVGNLSVGGTGKTPMVELLIHILGNTHKIALLSRGYRRKSKGFVLADSNSSVMEIGDEPFQVYSKFPEVTVAVDADRRNGISLLEKLVQPDLVLLDDAFQHRKVKPGFNILLTAYDNLYYNDWYLPTGDLRDSKHAAKRADVIIVTKCPKALSKEEQKRIANKLRTLEQEVLFAYLEYDMKLKGTLGEYNLTDLKNKEITLVTGIANPIPLVSYLHKNGLSFEHLGFKDHHFFTESEIEHLKTKACILTTEKDFVRLKEQLKNVVYISVKHTFLSDGKVSLEKKLDQFIKQYS